MNIDHAFTLSAFLSFKPYNLFKKDSEKQSLLFLNIN